MEPVIITYLSKLEFGELQQFEKLAIVPLLTSVNGSPKYLTLKEALDKKLLVVREVTGGGSVPELKVQNKADMPVLILDGEELAGAKQNRVLNTTILLKKQSETIIPVSCTEAGRWSYVSEEFFESGTVAAPRLRRGMRMSVARSLRSDGRFRSDQGEVWGDVADLACEADVSSPTGAMRDIFESQTKALDEYLKAFEPVLEQKGILVMINGEVVGFDVVSLHSAYTVLHPKLVKSYAMDAILKKRKKSSKPSRDLAKSFIDRASSSAEEKYQSVGHGVDYRFEGDKMVGSALVYRDKVIHIAFFKTTEAEKTGGMAGYGRRRGFRL